jgi:hypothetical protein
VAALYCNDRTTCQFIFPTFVEKASKTGFDFSTLNQNGQSVLHIATRTSYTDPRGFFPRINNVENVFKCASNPGLDVLSSSGSSALFYAINYCHFNEAKTLLEKGANPLLYKSKDRSPLDMIDRHIKDFNEVVFGTQNLDDYDLPEEQINNARYLIKSLEEIKELVLSSKYLIMDTAEIRKNARILAQGARGNSFFSKLPDETLVKIAANTKLTDFHSEKEATKIAEDHLERPKK